MLILKSIVDGTFVPKLPSKLLLDGSFHKNIAMFLGYTKFDGLLFTPRKSIHLSQLPLKASNKYLRAPHPGLLPLTL